MIKIYNEINQFKLSHLSHHIGMYIDFYFKRNNFSTKVNTDNFIDNKPFAFAYKPR